MRCPSDAQRHFALRLHCSNVCNHHCDYCHVFEDGNSVIDGPQLMDIGIARTAIETYAGFARGRDNASLKIAFYGGESMLNWRMIRQAIHYGNAELKDLHHVHWILNTNGTVMTPEIAETIRRNDVDVHLSLDGPDEDSNRYRKFKNGGPVIHKVRRSIQLLAKHECRLQFNTCLTDANWDALNSLVDYAVDNGADRIYLAFPDSAVDSAKDYFDVKRGALKIAAAVRYGAEKQIHVGGPWRQAISGGRQTLASMPEVPPLFLDPSGKAYLFPYPSRPLGRVDKLEEIINSAELQQLKTEWEKEKSACAGCHIEDTCAGYLKGMVMYHTGKSHGFEKECQLTLAIYDEFNTSNTKAASKDRKLRASNQLVVVEKKSARLVIQRTAQTAVRASDDLLELLDQFSEPMHPDELRKRYSIPDLEKTLAHLESIRFLLPESEDEALEWLKKIIPLDEKTHLKSEEFSIYHKTSDTRLARKFEKLMRSCTHYLKTRGLQPFSMRVLINICNNREEFKKFWGSAALPDWPKAFVACGCVLVVDPNKIRNVNWQSKAFIQGMAHELVHVYLHQTNCRLPVWLEEGVCEYFSGSYQREAFKKLAHTKGVYGFKEMELLVNRSLLDLDDSPVDENICYRQSHSFVAYLADSFSEKTLLEWIQSTGLRNDFRQQFEKIHGRELDDIEQEWLKAHGFLPNEGHSAAGNRIKLTLSKNFRSKQKGRKALIYNAFYGDHISADVSVLELLAGLKEGKTLRQLQTQFGANGLHAVLAELYHKKLIVFDNMEEENRPYQNTDTNKIFTGALIKSLRLNVSNACNMACTYCYIDRNDESNSRMPWPIAEKALNGFFRLLRQNRQENATIRFFGGEPLLNWKLIKQIFEYVDRLGKGIEIDYIVNTNGTCASADITEKLREYNALVAISIDGLETVHDRFRQFASGAGSFETIDKNLDLFLEQGCRVGVETTLGDHNYDHLNGVIEYLAAKIEKFDNPLHWSLQSICMPSGSGLDNTPIEEKIPKIIAAISYAEKHKIKVHDGMAQFPFNAFLGRRPRGHYCRAVGKEICVHPNGDVYPCGALNIKMGHIDEFDQIFRSEAYRNLARRVAGKIPACTGCDIEAFCAGGCVADAMGEGGDPFQRTKNCRLEESVFKALIDNYMLD